MSRLSGRSMELYQTSRLLAESNIPKYKIDKGKTNWEDVVMAPEKIDIYLPENAVEILESNPVKIVHYPSLFKQTASLPEKDGEEPLLFFPRHNAIEEYKNNLVFFLGEILANKSKDSLPDFYTIPCEYNVLLPLLMEYLYLKEENKEDLFIPKHLDDLAYNAKKYKKIYESHRNKLINRNELDLYDINYKKKEKIERYYAEEDEIFLRATLVTLVPMSSMDGVLQVIDRIKDKDEIKNFIEKLIENKEHNRQKIINDMGIDSTSYKRLKKEIIKGE